MCIQGFRYGEGKGGGVILKFDILKWWELGATLPHRTSLSPFVYYRHIPVHVYAQCVYNISMLGRKIKKVCLVFCRVGGWVHLRPFMHPPRYV